MRVDHPAIAAARALVDALVALGVRDAVLAPGSRSAPLAYALADAADAGRLRLHVRVDERSAGFLALGLARGTDDPRPVPVAVVTTSGTAAANLHPAVLEAHHGGVALLALTADRPHELRGTGANQTIDQAGLFGSATRWSVDVPAPQGAAAAAELRVLATRAVAAATGVRSGWPGPVHLNLAFRDPLVPGGAVLETDRFDDLRSAAGGSGRSGPVAQVVGGAVGEPVDASIAIGLDELATVVVAGDGAGGWARSLAEARGWPLLAETVSGSAGGPNLVPGHALVLEHAALAREVRRVVVLGRPTLSRAVQRLLASPDVDVVVVSPGSGPWPDAARSARLVLPAIPAEWLEPVPDAGSGGRRIAVPDAGSGGLPVTVPDAGSGGLPVTVPDAGWGGLAGPGSTEQTAASDWLARWRAAGRATAEAIDADLAERAPDALTGPVLAAEVARVSEPDDVIVVGSSNPVRDLETVARWAEPPFVVANRGVAGIDGLVSTATGVALADRLGYVGGDESRDAGAHRGTTEAGERASHVRALVGDLTFLHDVGGLLRAPGEPEPNLQLVVANDGGGSIFAGLEHGALAETSARRAAVFERVFSTPQHADLGALCAGYGVAHVRVADLAGLRAALAEPARGTQVLEVAIDRGDRRPDAARLSARVRAALSSLE